MISVPDPPASEYASLINRLEVFQVCDSTFPIGTFNHSFGMENYLRDRKITNTAGFREWFGNYLRTQFKYGEGLLSVLSWRALESGVYGKLWEYDQVITCSTVAMETRNGTKLIAKQMLHVIQRLYAGIDLLNAYSKKMSSGELSGNPAIVFAIFAHHKGIAQADTFLMYGYSIASTMVQNAVRAIPLGQGDGQSVLNDAIRLLGELYPVVCDLDESYLGANVPGIELAQILHETQGARLFMS